MVQTFTIYGRLPSLNEYIAAERAKYNAAARLKRQYQEIIISYINLSRLKPITSAVHITYRFYEKNRKRDKDNIAAIAHKFIQDSLVITGILKNDGWANIVGFSDEFYIDTKNPRIEVILNDAM